MSSLILDSIEIRRFRGFQQLTIDHLTRVNLIVGKNNVGKSSLLEALQLYARRASPRVIGQILGIRDENRGQRPLRDSNPEAALAAAKYLFYGRREITASMQPIEIGPTSPPEDRLFISILRFKRVVENEGIRYFQEPLFEVFDIAEPSFLRFTIQLGNQRGYNYPVSQILAPRVLRLEIEEIPCFSIEANGLSRREIGELWDNIALTDREKEVLRALRIIAPGVEGISVIGDQSSIRERTTIVKVAGIDEPLPIRSLGDGMQRMLGIALALVNAKDGILLIDEIENGLHYTVQLALWRLIFQLSRLLNVQVFATTHSWDCIKSFQAAAQEDEQVEGVLVRLEMKSGEIRAILFDEEKLAIATQEQIEVR